MKEIKFRETRDKALWGSQKYWTGTKNQFNFKIENNQSIYATVTHKKLDIRFNTLWSDIKFESLKDCFKWCNEFDYTKVKCLGKDATSSAE